MAWGLSGVSTWWQGPTKLPTEVIVQGRQIGLLEALIADINVKGESFWKGVTVHQLQRLNSVVHLARVKDHPFVEKLNKVTEIFPRAKFGHPIGHVPFQEALGGMQLHDHFARPEERPPFAHHFFQGNKSIEEVKKIIESRGHELSALNLTSVDDDLLKTIALRCTELPTLRIHLKAEATPPYFSDAGLFALTKFRFHTLELSIWNAVHVSRRGLLDFLTKLSCGPRELALSTQLVNDEVLEIVKCFPLIRLSLESTEMTSQGLEKLLDTKYMPQFLESLTLKKGKDDGPLVAGSLLLKIGQLRRLTELVLDGTWEPQDSQLQHLQKMLEGFGFINLKKLRLNGVTLTPEILKGIQQLYQLQELYLGDCSALKEEGLRHFSEDEAAKNREALGLRSVRLTGDTHSQFLYHFVNLTSLSLIDCCCSLKDVFSRVKKLTYLELADSTHHSGEDFSYIGQLTQLATLRITNCRFFNDDSLPNLSKLPIKYLEFSKVSLSDRGMSTVAEWPLEWVKLSSCGGVTTKGLQTFLAQPQLHEKVQRLQLDAFVISRETMGALRVYKNLQLFVLGTPFFCEKNDKDYWGDIIEELRSKSTRVVLNFEKNVESGFGNWSTFIRT